MKIANVGITEKKVTLHKWWRGHQNDRHKKLHKVSRSFALWKLLSIKLMYRKTWKGKNTKTKKKVKKGRK